MNKLTVWMVALILGLGAQGIRAYQVDNNWDDNYNQGIPVQADDQGYAWYNPLRYFPPVWGSSKQDVQQPVVADDAQDEDDQGYAWYNPQRYLPTWGSSQEESATVVAPAVVTPQIKQVLAANPVLQAVAQLDNAANIALTLDRDMHRYSFGAEVELQNGNIASSQEILKAGLQFIQSKRADGRDKAIYADYEDLFISVLALLQ